MSDDELREFIAQVLPRHFDGNFTDANDMPAQSERQFCVTTKLPAALSDASIVLFSREVARREVGERFAAPSHQL